MQEQKGTGVTQENSNQHNIDENGPRTTENESYINRDKLGITLNY